MSDASDYFADPADVRNELEREEHPTEQIADAQIESFLDKAHMLVSEELADVGHSDDRLRYIEACLTGHYILDSGIDSLRQATRLQESDGALRWFGDIEEFGLEGTSLGQQAIELDTSGRLRQIAAREVSEGQNHEFTLI